jgi:hypothetical protein
LGSGSGPLRSSLATSTLRTRSHSTSILSVNMVVDSTNTVRSSQLPVNRRFARTSLLEGHNFYINIQHTLRNFRTATPSLSWIKKTIVNLFFTCQFLLFFPLVRSS